MPYFQGISYMQLRLQHKRQIKIVAADEAASVAETTAMATTTETEAAKLEVAARKSATAAAAKSLNET